MRTQLEHGAGADSASATSSLTIRRPVPDASRDVRRGSRWPRRRVFATIVVAVPLSGAVFWVILTGTAAASRRPLSPSPLPVSVMRVDLTDRVELPREYTGELVAPRVSGLCFERGGLLARVAVDEGDRVQADHVLAELDTESAELQWRELRAQVRAAMALLEEMEAGPRPEAIAVAEAQVKERQAQWELLSRKHERLAQLYEKGAAGAREFEDAISQLSSAAARLEASRQQLQELLAGTRPEQIERQLAIVEQLTTAAERAELGLRRSVMTAPFDGFIAKRFMNEGRVVAPGQPVLELIEDAYLEARIGVPVDSLVRLPMDSEHSLRVGSRICRARVSAVLPRLDSATRTVIVVLTLLEKDHAELLPGRIASVCLHATVEAEGFWAPTGALVSGDRGLWAVYVLINPDGDPWTSSEPVTPAQIERRDVEALYTSGDRVFVHGLVDSGEHIVAEGAHRVVTGQLVRAMPITGDVIGTAVTSR